MEKEKRTAIVQLSEFIKHYLKGHDSLSLNYICTHNSRRSQFAQVWSHYYANKFDLPIRSFSGGVEVTACHPNTIAALERAGFAIQRGSNAENPKYEVKIGGGERLVLFSKVYDDVVNPTGDFVAIMTCDHANENCPFIPGTLERVPLTFEDPKRYDGTKDESSRYDQTCEEIRLVIKAVFESVKN